MKNKKNAKNPNQGKSAKANVNTQPTTGVNKAQHDSDMKIYPEGYANQVSNTYGANQTQAISDDSRKYNNSNVNKPSGKAVKDARGWIGENKK